MNMTYTRIMKITTKRGVSLLPRVDTSVGLWNFRFVQKWSYTVFALWIDSSKLKWRIRELKVVLTWFTHAWNRGVSVPTSTSLLYSAQRSIFEDSGFAKKKKKLGNFGNVFSWMGSLISLNEACNENFNPLPAEVLLGRSNENHCFACPAYVPRLLNSLSHYSLVHPVKAHACLVRGSMCLSSFSSHYHFLQLVLSWQTPWWQ